MPYLRARSGKNTSGSGDVTFSSPMVAEVADTVKRIAAQASDGSFTGVRENDVLTDALENPDTTRGIPLLQRICVARILIKHW